MKAMRLFSALAALAVLVISCTTPEQSRPSDTPRPSPRAPAVVLAKLGVAAKFGEQGMRVSPNGEMLLVVEREGFVHTIYDLAGRSLANVKLGEIGMNPFWLPDSSGVVIGRRITVEPSGALVRYDMSILEVDGSVREIGKGMAYPRAEGQLASPDGQSLAFDTPCCPSSVVIVPRRGGAAREVATSPTQLHVLTWDADGHVVYWAAGGDAIDAARTDGSTYRVTLGLPSGIKALDIAPGVRTADAIATVLSIQADGSFPGAVKKNAAERTLVARELRAYQSDVPLYALTAHEGLTYSLVGAVGAYDVTTGISRPLAMIRDDARWQPTALSAGLLMTSPGRTWVRVLDVQHDDRWHETDVGRILQAAGYALSRGRFLVFDEDGAPYVLDGVAARAAPARAVPTTDSPNAAAGTVRAARNAVVGKKMELTWRMTDGTPQSLDYFGTSLVVIALWKRPCVVCTQQLGLLSDVATGSRSRLEIIGIGVDETEASALEVARDYRRLRPLVGSADVLKDIGPGLLPQTFILDSDHVVRNVIFGPLTWDALVRALTAASKSRLALRDGDVALS
jgi:hypothetical protein